MRGLLILFICLCSFTLFAQKVDFTLHSISLPPEISFYDNQFSGLYTNDNSLFLMSESRLQDSAEAKIYSIQIKDIEKQLIDTSFTLPFKKIPIYNLDILRHKMKANGDDYEGLEAMLIDHKQIYFSVETATPSNNCYLLKGIMNDTAVVVDTEHFVVMKKPTTGDGKHIYNAGFEAIALSKKTILSFFEYNYFPDRNVVNTVAIRSFSLEKERSFSMQKLPFRITDITAIGKHEFIAINYFYNGGGEDEVYRVPPTDTVNKRLVYDSGRYKNYTRLISIKKKKKSYIWEPLWEFPQALSGYNWEGIAVYKKGYFIINDKYTPSRPYKSVLLYLQFSK